MLDVISLTARDRASRNCFDIKGGSMRTRWIAAFVVLAALASTSASTQTPGTQTQQSQDDGSNLIWNLVGCLGLLGLFGLQRQSDNDGYTDDPI
jgi:hypothetical protein